MLDQECSDRCWLEREVDCGDGKVGRPDVREGRGEVDSDQWGEANVSACGCLGLVGDGSVLLKCVSGCSSRYIVLLRPRCENAGCLFPSRWCHVDEDTSASRS